MNGFIEAQNRTPSHSFFEPFSLFTVVMLCKVLGYIAMGAALICVFGMFLLLIKDCVDMFYPIMALIGTLISTAMNLLTIETLE